MRKPFAAFLLFTIVAIVARGDVRGALEVATNAATLPMPADRPWCVLFADEPVAVTVRFGLAEYPGPHGGPGNVAFSSPEWWKDIRLVIVGPEGAERPLVSLRADAIPGKEIATDLVVRPQSMIAARLILPSLAPGRYTIQARFREWSDSTSFRVVTGTENDIVRVEALRRTAARTADFPTVRKLYLEVAGLRPTDAWPWLELALRAISQAPVEETRGYLREAFAREQRRIAEYPASGRPHAPDPVAFLESLRELNDALPLIYQKRATTFISRGERGEFILVNRATGAVENRLTRHVQ